MNEFLWSPEGVRVELGVEKVFWNGIRMDSNERFSASFLPHFFECWIECRKSVAEDSKGLFRI